MNGDNVVRRDNNHITIAMKGMEKVREIGFSDSKRGLCIGLGFLDEYGPC